jgi:hypothetical protein
VLGLHFAARVLDFIMPFFHVSRAGVAAIILDTRFISQRSSRAVK